MRNKEFRNLDNDRSSVVFNDRKDASEYDPLDLLLSHNLVAGRHVDAYRNKAKRKHDEEKQVLNHPPSNDLTYQPMFDHITKQGKGRQNFVGRHILSLNNPEITTIRNSTLLNSDKVKQQQSLPMPNRGPNNRTKRSRSYNESDLNAIMKIIEGRKIKNNNGSKFITDKELNKVIDNYYLQNPQLMTFNSSKNYKKTNTVILSKNSPTNPPATAITNSKVLNRTHPDLDSYQTRYLPELQTTLDSNVVSISKQPPPKEYRNFHPEAPYNRNSTINIYINSLFAIPGVPKGMNNLVLHIPRDKIAQLFKGKNGTSDINIDLGNVIPNMNDTQPQLLHGEKYRKDGTYTVKRDSITYQPPSTTPPSIQIDENRDPDLTTGLATPYTLTPKHMHKDETYAVKRDGITYHPPPTTQRSIQMEENKGLDMIIELTTPYTVTPKNVPKDETYAVTRDGITYPPSPIIQRTIHMGENKGLDTRTGLATPYTPTPKNVPKDETYAVKRDGITYQPPQIAQRSIQMGVNKDQTMITKLASPYTLEPKSVPKDEYYTVKKESMMYEPPPPTQPSIQIDENKDQDSMTEPVTLYTVAPMSLPISKTTVIPSETMKKLKYLLGIRSANQSRILASLQGVDKTSYSSTPSNFYPPKPLPSIMPSSYAPSVDPQYDNMTLYSISLNGQKRNISQSAISIFNKKYDQQKNTLELINGSLTLKPSSSTASLVNKSNPISLEKLSAEVESLHNKIDVAVDVHKKEILKSSLLILRKQNDKHQETLDEMNEMASNDVFGSGGIPDGDHMENKSKSDDINKNVNVTSASKMPVFVDRFIQQSKRFNSMKDRTAQKDDDVNRDAIEDTKESFEMSRLPGAHTEPSFAPNVLPPKASINMSRLSGANKRFRGQKSRVNVLKDISGSIAKNTSSSFPLAQMVKLHPIERRLENELTSFANISRLGEQLIDQKGFLKTIMKRTNEPAETVSNNQNIVLQIKSQDTMIPMLPGGALSKPILSQGIYDLK